jgi:pectate lyase
VTYPLFVCDGFSGGCCLYRWGTCHVINNLYTNWGYYALGARVHAKIISESNVFVPLRRKEVTPWFKGAGPDFDQSASIISFNDLLTNGCTFHQSLVYNPSMSMHPSYPPTARYPPITPTSQLSSLVKTCSGALFGPNLKLCLSHSRTN